MRWKEASGLAQLVTSFAILSVVSFGLCGINWAFPNRGSEFGWTAFGVLGFLGLIVSFFGLVGVGVAFLGKLVIDKVFREDKPVHLFDPQESSAPRDKTENDEDKP
jgi:hypothetical protein